jgi:hypothetical protein
VRRPALSLTLLALTACGDAPQVEVVTRVGEPAPRAAADGLLARALMLRADRERELADPALDAMLAALPAEEDAPAPRPPRAAAPPVAGILQVLSDMSPKTAAPTSPPTRADEFAALLAALERAPAGELAPIADALAQTPASLWPEVEAALLAERKARKADYKALLSLIGGDVPNRYGHFELGWKKAHGHTVKLSEDWYADLLALPAGRVGKALRGIYRDCVQTAALLRAASAIGCDPARSEQVVEALLAAAYVHDGTFRDEVGRAIRRLGEPAIPALLRRSVPPPLPDDEEAAVVVRAGVPFRRAEYARVQLDRMDRLHPRKAIAAVRDDPRLLADLLAAYGVARLDDAAAPLLEHVDAPIPRVRAAARAAFLAYVEGPPPRTEHRTVRLLGGRTGDGPARLNYRDFARLAIRERVAADHPDLLEPECRPITQAGTRDRACEAQSLRLATAYFARLEAHRRAREQAQVDAALAASDRAATVAILDALLAENPELEMRAQLVPTYEAAADEAEAAGDRRRAAGLLRKSAALLAAEDPGRSDRLRLRALLVEAEIDALAPEGRAMLLATAEALAPDDPAVAAALARTAARPARVEDAGLPRKAGLAALAVAAGLLLLLALGHLLRARTTRRAAA